MTSHLYAPDGTPWCHFRGGTECVNYPCHNPLHRPPSDWYIEGADGATIGPFISFSEAQATWAEYHIVAYTGRSYDETQHKDLQDDIMAVPTERGAVQQAQVPPRRTVTRGAENPALNG